ncbi:MAG: phosphoribosylformylglycinamidine cyclo-ligase [Bacteroidetes bacterium]|nr:MAG: phosphoribosylformylglycinamidine cyclo-ligase [Bacteroidota bacterium]
MSLYSERGVSSQKEEVHAAIKNLDSGLYPYAFCKIFPDYMGKDSGWVNVMHADGAGTKSILAYLYWKETGDISVWKGIAQDAIVMNLDDLLCVGICDDIIFNSTIDRNKLLIPGAVLEQVIEGSREMFETLKKFGINISYLGGETADVGDVVRTIAVNGTMTARWPKSKLITNQKISPGDVIVGLASDGQASYETQYNSGIGSNGLTSARHDMLKKSYADEFPESLDPNLNHKVVYIGPYSLTQEVPGSTIPGLNIGKFLLSPTRTFAPVMKKLLEEHFDNIHGLIHSSGGGQTKCMKYLPGNMKVIKDNLFEPPLIFKLIQQSNGSSSKEMYEVFNMGIRMEIFTNPQHADEIIKVANSFNIEARVIGRVEGSSRKELHIITPKEVITY